MPGNEVGDRIHNFFGQENLSRGEHRSEVVDGTWPVLVNNPWAGSQRHIGTSFSNLKNHSLQQSADSERVHGGQSSNVQHGVNFSQSILRPEFTRSQSQNQQPTLNGYVHGNQTLQTRHNDTNFLGVDLEPDQCNLTSRGFSILDAQLGSSPELHKKSSVRMDFNESPVNFDFLGGQQQISSQHPGMFQSLPRQQSGIRDMQLLQQQVMLKQMHEIQRQQQLQKQQLQQQDVGQLNSVKQVSLFAKQGAGCHPSTLVNGIPVHDASNCLWQPELMAANTNWLQRGMSQAMQGSSSGLMFSPEHGQALPLTGMIPQQVDQSLYGVPISGTRVAPRQYSPVQMDKSTIQHISGSSNAFSGDQYAGFSDLSGMQDSTLASRQGYQGKNMIETAASQGLVGGLNLENLQRVGPHQSSGPGQDFHGRLDVGGSSETSLQKTAMQVAPSQNAATLDPTEERILFGEDDNLWEAFGRGTSIGSGGFNMVESTDLLGAFPSLQSGSWSALMQSAVAETSSADTGLQEEWKGLTFQGNIPLAENQQTPTVNDSGKQQSTGVDNKLQAASVPNARPYTMNDGTNSGINNYINMPEVKQSGEWREKLHAGSSQRSVQPFSGEGTKWLDCNPLQKPVSEGSHNYEKGAQASDAGPKAKNGSGPSGSLTNHLSIYSSNTGNQPGTKPNDWNFVDSVAAATGSVLKNQVNENTLRASHSTEWKTPMLMGYGAVTWKTDSVSNSIAELEHPKSTTGSPQVNKEDSNLKDIANLPDSSAVWANQERSQQLPHGNSIDIWKHVGSSVNPKEREFPGKYQSRMDKSCQVFASSGNSNLGNGAVETHDFSDTKESKTDSFHNVSNRTPSVSGVREKSWLDANDSLTLSEEKLKSSVHVGRKPSGVRKFQYHPMGDLDADVEPSYGAKYVTHPQSTPVQVSQGLKGHDHGGIGNSKFPVQIARNSVELDKLHFARQGETKGSDEMSAKSIFLVSELGAFTSSDRAVSNYATSKTTPSRFASQSKQMSETFQRAHSGQSALASVPEMSRSHDDVTYSGEIHKLSNNNQSSKKDSAQQFPVLEAAPAPQGSNISGTSQENSSAARMSGTEWTSVSTRQCSFDTQAFKALSNIQSNNDSETTSSTPQKLEGHGLQTVRSDPSGAYSVHSCGFVGKEQATKGDPCQQVSPDNDHLQKTMSLSEGKESVANCLTDTSLANPASTQREIEAFGRSLRSNNILHQNYLLLHQVQHMEIEDVDPDNRSLKRCKRPDVAVDAQQIGSPGGQQLYGHNMVTDASTNCASVPTGDSKMLSFSARLADVRDTNMPCQDILRLGQNDTQNFANSSAVPVRTEQSQISPQMAPSWFDQYGTFKNGQTLPLHDAQKNVSMKMKTWELPFAVGRPSNSLHCHGPLEQENVIASQHSILQKSSTMEPLANENLSSPQLIHHDAGDVSLVAVRPKKRKTDTSELIPWNKQVAIGLQRLSIISSAEVDWSRATNRLTEKVEDETEMVEDVPPAFRSKRRLILTTQLMQLLIHPPLASILSADATSHYESVIHFLARSTLGDACSTLSCAGSDTSGPSSSGNILPLKLNTSERINNQYFSKVVEDLISRARKLENDLLRLDKKASVLDLRVECQELEKYSVINRFAKFHGRGQADGADTSSSSDALQKSSCLQRYVTALPMPRNLPDRVQCFSL
ncbi:uncharacterized protein LOC110599906 isoform X2 [Manihot esculenta]|uniref:uncharacterized protein LOC110599906 isoform X2 n=1 Tax=Manihot esculenta TaxID=3983 RepID=UPI000B5D24BC|nr:uncharacterized protein LOC110599906 isoform X2 [Manihot esculenta]